MASGSQSSVDYATVAEDITTWLNDEFELLESIAILYKTNLFNPSVSTYIE